MLSDTIKEIRKRHYLNQTAFANKIGVTQSAVSQWENGLTKPNSEQLLAISAAFNISIDELLNADNEPGKPQPPMTIEARILAKGMDQLPQEQRERALNMMRALYPGLFEKGESNDT